MMRWIRKLLISRTFTSAIHYLLDYILPPIIRDNRYFMWPFYKAAFKGMDLEKQMNFKANFYNIGTSDLEKIYENYNTIGTERETDLNKQSVRKILERIDPASKTVLDVACGKGFLARKLLDIGYQVTGVDLFHNDGEMKFNYVRANIEELPFADKAFDTAISTHTLEHVLDIRKAVLELKRVAQKQIIVVVPCQRFNYYTLDHHLHFLPKKEMLVNLIRLNNYEIMKAGGDWIYIGYLK